MFSATQLRLFVGQSAGRVLDEAVSAKWLPRRFPLGIHLEHDLQKLLAAPVTQIVDGGANVGDTAIRFARYFNGATVHAFEPVSATFRQLQKRASGHPRIVCQPLAIGEEEADLSISLSDDSEQNSLLNNAVAPGGPKSETIHVVRLDRYAETHGIEKIDLLKLDLEGYELPALRGAGRLLEKGAIRAIYSECGFDNGDRYKTSFGELSNVIQAHGFFFSGFYQFYRWGPDKCRTAFSNALWLHH